MPKKIIEFKKMHGLGNDFVILDARNLSEKNKLEPAEARVRTLCHRKHGIGCDQLIILHATAGKGDVAMKIYNADGKSVKACGNASRCVADIIMSETAKEEINIESPAGLLRCFRRESGICIDMNAPGLNWQDIPLARPEDTEALFLDIPGFDLPAVCINIGNPHAVFFVQNHEDIDISSIGPLVESHNIFPEKTNVEFVELRDPGHLRMRVWERGVGITQACGTGACAAAVAGVLKGHTSRLVQVELDGGQLEIEWRQGDNHVYMTGPVTYVFDGVIEID